MTAPPVAGPPVATTRRARAGWILFDWALQPFFTLVTTFVFAPYVATALAPTPALGQAWWSYATAAAGLVLAALAPVLGAVADASGPRKPWIAASTAILGLACAALWFAAPGAPHGLAIALVAFAVATVAAEVAAVFNNAMMTSLVPKERLGRLSGAGWAAGYAGGLVSLVIVLGFLAADPTSGRTYFGIPPLFGLDPALREGDRATGPFSALWMALFLLPLFMFTPDIASRGVALAEAARDGFRRLVATWAEAKADPRLPTFLVANMVWQDGLVALFALSGIYGAGVFGWGTLELGLFGIMLTFVGVAGSLIGGALDDRLGPRRVIFVALSVLVAVCCVTISLSRDTVFFVIPVTPPSPGDGLFATWPERIFMAAGLFIGMVAGPLQASSRTLLTRIAPPDAAGRYFGLFAMSGKLTSFAAPLAIAVATQVTGMQAAAPAVLIAVFALAALLLAQVAAGERA